MCCTDEERKRYNEQLLTIVKTHVAPSFAHNEKTNDFYAAYNKPGAVYDFLKHVVPQEEWMLVLDSDMYLRKPFYPSFFNAKKGWCISADYTYMIGVNNELATRHIPEIGPRNDTLAGPYGRRGDQVGGFFYMHREDLQRVAPLWLKFTEDVREDPEAWRLSGDQYVEKGGKPWISEMYGYAFGAAKANVWHKWDRKTMTYPTYRPEEGIPKLIHYGLLFEVGKNYSYDKHWHYDFDVTKCPPWDFSDPKRRTGGIFPAPPRPSTLDRGDFIGFYKDLIAIETVATLNAAFCDYHISHCPPNQQIVDVCKEVFSLYNEVHLYILEVEAHFDCQDWNPKCETWKAAGDCDHNPQFMMEDCRKTCGWCGPRMQLPATLTKDLDEKLAKMANELLPLAEDPDTKKGSKGVEPKTSAETKEAKISETTTTATTEVKATEAEDSSQSPTEAPKTRHPPPSHPKSPPPESPAHPPKVPLKSPSPPPDSPDHPPHRPPKSPRKPLTPRRPHRPPKVPAGLEKKIRDLTIACYRLALPLDEVKACVRDAKKGIDWNAAHGGQKAEVKDAIEGDSHTESDVLDPTGSTKEDTQATRSKKTEQEGGVDSVDPNDLTLRQTRETVAPDTKVIVAPASLLHSLFGGMGTWHSLVIWVVIVGAFLAVLPRIARMRRRQRSGMRTE
ncbi:hypothetical protein HYH03_003211 [Edaphochlamys debaryana]|uniref:ShKT domain-containing protein n=1 Tax=Edaphochlamys debaryana TaxID=47281 RepID=A0A835YDT2_9CHLO|nr:hypothetical protein HYH03_003211 [Edaphochlamys debaryana]|eukprot:KAG2499026.1 hypothetical protein HYH03_003211 [Edaphochlamys debaryana]